MERQALQGRNQNFGLAGLEFDAYSKKGLSYKASRLGTSF